MYMRFLRIALEKGASVGTQDGRVQLDKALTHGMKANVCLLLYSAMEASTIQMLDEIHEVIGEHCQGTDQLNSQLVVKVARHFKASKPNVTEDNTSSPLHESLFKAWLKDWKDRSQKGKREAGLSGAVDSLAIFDQLKGFGLFSPDLKGPPRHLAHSALQTVKERRNKLAHGERSFADLGLDLSFDELLQQAVAVFRTLRNIVREVNLFLQRQGYLA
jgi:hypothetical protein